jgi:hypothetical protein
MHITKHSISVVAGTSKGDVEYTNVINGVVRAVQYAKSTSGALSSTATLAIETAVTGVSVLSSLTVSTGSWVKAPALTVVNTTNGAITNAHRMIPVDNERLKLTIAATSVAAQTGTFYVYSEGN